MITHTPTPFGRMVARLSKRVEDWFDACFTPAIDAKSLEMQAVTHVTDLAANDAQLAEFRQRFIAEEKVAEPTPPKPKKTKRHQQRAKVISFVERYVERHGEAPRFKTVKGRFKLSKATASRWRNEALQKIG